MILQLKNILTGTYEDFVPLRKIKKVPLFNGCIDLCQPKESDQFIDLEFYQSNVNGFIQLKCSLDVDKIYNEQTTTSALGNTWIAHHHQFSEFIGKQNIQHVVEIGGAHGFLGKYV